MREETPSAVDWAAVYGNWIAIDKIVYGLVNHHHTGSAALANPDAAPTLSTAVTGGVLPAGITYYGVVSYYDSSGRETGKSAAGTITTTAAIAAPNTPLHNFQATPTDLVADNSATPVGLLGGDYWYKLTYIKGGGETTASQPVYVSVPTDTLYAATIHFDSLTTAANGATKIYIYRKSGSTGSYVKLIEISAVGTSSYTDNNVAVPTCDKQPPATNTTNAFNTVTFDWSALNYSDAAYVNLYITTTGTVGTPTFTSSTHRITSVTVDLATPVTSYEWTGTALTTGKPLSTSQCFIYPPKIILDSEVTGNLPLASLPSILSWGQPVADNAALALETGVIDGEIRFVTETETLEYWDGDLATPTWVNIVSGLELVQLNAYFDIANDFDTSVLPNLPSNPTDGQIVAVRNSESVFGGLTDYVYLYMWRDDWATPAWQLVNPVLPSLDSGMTNYSNYAAPPGSMWLKEWAGAWNIRIMQADGGATTVPSYTGIESYFSYYGTSEVDVNWGEAPHSGYGALTFFWDDKSFYYYTDDATPAWAKLIGPSGTTVADVTESATPTDVELKLNELLAALRTSGVINT